MRLIESTTGNGAALADRGLQSDWEGIIVKRPDGRYASGNRGSGWQKLKFTRSEEFVVGGWTLPRGSRRHFGALLLGYYAAGEGLATGALVFAGQVGTGFTDAELDRIAGLLAPLETDVPPFVALAQPKPSEKRRWVEPVLVVQTGFSQWTPDGVLRHPVPPGPAGRQAAGGRAPPGTAPRRRPATPIRPRDAPRHGRPGASGRQRASHGGQRRRPPRRNPRTRRPHRNRRTPAHPEPGIDNLLAQLEDLERNRRRGTLVLSTGARVPVGNLHKIFWPEGASPRASCSATSSAWRPTCCRSLPTGRSS